jgi:hypothetical protein
MKKRIWALLLILCMVMSLLSVTAWAEDGDDDNTTEDTTTVTPAEQSSDDPVRTRPLSATTITLRCRQHSPLP